MLTLSGLDKKSGYVFVDIHSQQLLVSYSHLLEIAPYEEWKEYGKVYGTYPPHTLMKMLPDGTRLYKKEGKIFCTTGDGKAVKDRKIVDCIGKAVAYRMKRGM